MRFFIVIVNLVLWIALVEDAHARSLEAIQKAGVIRVAFDGASPPFNQFEGKHLVGFEVDLVEEMAKRLKLKVEISTKPFGSLLLSLKQDHYDLIGTSFAYTEEREKVVDFVTPHYCIAAVIVSKPKGPKKVSELEGKSIVIPVGTMYLDKLKTHMHFKEIRTVPTELDGLQSLLAGPDDQAWVTENLLAEEAVKRNPKSGIQIGEKIQDLINAMIVDKGNTALRDEVNRLLNGFLKDGTYHKLSLKYFGKDIRCTQTK